MRTWTATLLAGCATAVASQTVPSLPSLPNQFEAWVACNIVNKNYTVTVHEVYDGPGNRAVLSMYHPLASSPNYVPPPPVSGGPPSNTTRLGQDQGVSKTLYQYSQDTYYHTNSSGCWAGNVSNLRFGFTGSSTGHIPSVSRWFDFGSAVGETYMGRTTVNGESVNWWRSDQSNATAGTTMVVDYYFTTPDWAVWNGNGSQLPVMLNLTGSRPNYSVSRLPNGTMVPVINGIHSYHHVYSFNGFHVGSPRHGGQQVFTLPAGTTCVSLDGTDVSNLPLATAGVSSTGSSGTPSGGVAMIAVGSALLGALVTAAAMKLARRGDSETKQPTFNNALTTNNPAMDEALA